MSSKNVGKPLTVDLIFTKTKSDSLHNIKNLNLWGNDLEDLKLIEKMPNLEVVSLSVNRIHTLKDFARCGRLQELYLRKNNISDINQIRYLMKLPNLKVLWLHDNPCALTQNYRQIVIKNLPLLMKLDNSVISAEDRAISNQKIKETLDSYDENEQINNKNIQEKWPSKQNYEPKQQNIKSKPLSSLKNKQIKQVKQVIPNQQISRNQNILMAILSLMRELDNGSIEIIRREAQSMIN